MLTSLNRSLYNVILMQLDISLTGCCYACRTHIHAATSNELLIAAGERIIRCYAEELCSSQNRNQLFRKACTYIQNHLEENLTITQLCNQLHVSRSSPMPTFPRANRQLLLRLPEAPANLPRPLFAEFKRHSALRI